APPSSSRGHDLHSSRRTPTRGAHPTLSTSLARFPSRPLLTVGVTNSVSTVERQQQLAGNGVTIASPENYEFPVDRPSDRKCSFPWGGGRSDGSTPPSDRGRPRPDHEEMLRGAAGDFLAERAALRRFLRVSGIASA